MENKRITNHSIDLFKGICCIGIVLIHCTFPGIVGDSVRAVARFCVPFFFMVSGYFLYDSNQSINNERVIKKIKNIVYIVLFAAVFYLVFYFCSYCVIGNSSPLTEFTNQVSAIKTIRFLVTNTPFVYSHLWFLFALIYCYVLCMVLGNKLLHLNWKIPYIVISLSIFTILAEVMPALGIAAEAGYVQINFYNLFIFRAFPFFCLGVLFREEKILPQIEINGIKLVFLCLMTIAGSILERLLFVDAQFYLSSYVMVMTIFKYCLDKPNSRIRSIEYIGEKLSLYVYVIHFGVINAMDFVTQRIGLSSNVLFMWSRPVFAIVVSLIGAQFFYLVGNRLKHKGVFS